MKSAYGTAADPSCKNAEKQDSDKLLKLCILAGVIAFVISTAVTFVIPKRFPFLAFICLLVLNLSLCGGMIYYIYNYMRTHGFLPKDVAANVRDFPFAQTFRRSGVDADDFHLGGKPYEEHFRFCAPDINKGYNIFLNHFTSLSYARSRAFPEAE